MNKFQGAATRCLLLCWVLATTSCAFAAPVNLAPPLVGKNAAGQEWTPVRTVDHAAPERDFSVRLKQDASLKIGSRQLNSGYGEWRITPPPTLEKGATYVFAAALRQRAIEGSPPYLRVYSFNAAGTPRIIAFVAGKIGDSNWYSIQTKFQVPSDSASLRFDAGLIDSRGAVYFGDFQLYQDTGEAPPLMLAETAQSTPAVKWRAQWIASASVAENTTFSTMVDLPQIPLDAYTQIAADGEWSLKVNRHFVATGSSWGAIKSFDLAPFLNVGRNEISVEVVKKGARAALLCQGDWRLPQGKTLSFQSDATWTTGNDKAAVALLDASLAPPLSAVPLQNVAHFPQQTVSRVEAPRAISTGATWTTKVFLAAPLPAAERKNWTLQWTRDGQDASLSAVPARVLPTADGRALDVSCAVSAFATPGKYRWALVGDGARIIPTQNREVEISAATLVTPASFRWPPRPANAMTVAGETGAPYMMNTARREVESYRNWTRATGLHLYEVWLPLSGAWTSPDEINLSELELSLLKILEADPKAVVNVIVRFDMPPWWCRQNPAECYVSDKGKRSAQSFFSLRWREDIAAAMQLLKRELDTLPAAKRIGGVVLAGGEGGEMLLPGRTYGEYDVSPAARKAFAAWCAKNNIAPVTYPNAAMQRPYPMGDDDKAARRAIFHFFADWQADNLVFFSHRAKEIFGANFQVAAYYGYIMELGDYRAANGPRLMYSGHLGLQKVLDEGAFDCLMSISTYSLRKSGLVGGFMGPVDSVFLRGLTHLNENDIRTHLVKEADSAGAPTVDLNQTRELYRREMLNAAQKGVAIRYHSLLRDVDFLQDPQLLQFIGELGREVQTLKPLALGDKNQVAFVIDEEALFDLTSLSTWETLPPQFLGKARDSLSRMNRPVAWLLWSDWAKNKDKFKTAIFPLPSLLSPEHRKQVEVWAGSTLPKLDDNSGALVADKTGVPSLSAFTNLNDLVRAVGGAGSGEGTPVRYTGENFRVEYADGKFTTP